MSSAEGLFVQEKKDTSKLKLKIRLTKSGGFVSISGNEEGVSSQETSGSQFNENIHNEQEYFDTLPSHHRLPWTRTQSSTPVLTNKKKVRKKKQKNRQVASDKDIFKESPCGVSEGHRLSSCQSASYPPSQLERSAVSCVKLRASQSQPLTDVGSEPGEITAMDTRLNMSASASEGGDVLLNHMVLLPDIHKSGDVDLSAGAGHSVDTVSNCSSAGSEFMGYKHADEASSDDVDSHFHHSQIPSVIPSHSGQEQRCSGIVQMSLCSEGDSETPLAASCAEDRSDNAMTEEIEMNNNLSELHTDDHASFGVPDGHGPLSSMSMTGDQGLRHKQTDKCSNKGTAPYPEMLFSNSFAEVIDSARGNMGLTSLVKSTGARACGHSDMVEDLTEAGSDKDPGAENSNKESQAVGGTGLSLGCRERLRYLLSCTSSPAAHTFVSLPLQTMSETSGCLHPVYTLADTSPHNVNLAPAFNADEPLDQIGSSASGSTSHRKCMGHKPTNGSKETLEKQKTPDALPQKDRPGPVSSKRCRCKVPVPQETISEAGGSARAGERRMCGKCMKRIPLRRPKKQTKSPDICCFSGKHKPHLVLKEHNYSRSARHLSFQALNVLLNETEKHNDENKSQMACDSEVDERESHGNVAVYVFPPKFGSEINTYREEQRPLQEPHGVPLKEVEGKRAVDSIICCQTMPVQLHKDTCPQALDPACRQSQPESCKTSQEHSCMKNEQNSCGKTEKKVRHKMKPKTKQPKKSEMETIVHNDFAVLDTFGIDPCYVVLERTPGAVHRKARHRPPCPKHCRAESLDFLCEVGKLVHCKHSVSEQSLSVEPDNSKQRLGVFNPKRDFLRHNKTLEGYEEYRQQQLQAIRMKRMKENGVFEGGQIIGNSMDMFFPLSSLCAEGITDTHVSNSSIKTEQGLVGKRKSEESDPRSHCMHSHVRERGQDELTAPGLPKGPKHRPKRKVRVDAQDELGAATNVSSGSHKQLCDDIDEKSHPVDRCLRSDTIERKKAVTEEAEMDKMKMSKFDVKYYVFEADGRAFVVPLIRTSCRVGSVNRLDDEDLLYVKTVISFLLEEKTSCARHLGYHESLKQKRKSRSLTKSERFKPLMVGSVEEFHIECLKIVASDPHVLNLAPQNNKISEIEYLTQLGEEVYLYLTGAMEDAPPWIKELAKKVVAKQRQKIQNKNRLRPSKDVTIEIDYAEECSDIDVGEEEEVSIVNSGISLDVCGLSADGAETQLALATPDADVSYGAVGGVPFTEPVQPGKENTGQPTGSYVSEDVYVQDAKPLLSDLMQVSQTPITGDTAEMPFHGQHISVPLPPSFESVQNSASDWNPHTGLSVVVPSSSEYTTLTQEAEEPDRKPLAHELLAAASVSVPLLEPPQEQFHTQQAGHLHQQQTQEQNPGWPYAIVKQEPPDDYSFALSGGVKEETPAPVPEDSSATGNPVLPFITADTFGQGIVPLEQETQDVQRGEKNVKQLSVETKSLIHEPQLSQLSPWMVPDVDHSTSLRTESRPSFEQSFPSGFVLAGRHIVVVPVPKQGFVPASETDWSGCPESADVYEEDCDQFEDDGEDVIEDEECIDGGGEQIVENGVVSSNNTELMPIITEVCGADGVTCESESAATESQSTAADHLPVITEVCGADAVDFLDQTVAVNISCDERSTVIAGTSEDAELPGDISVGVLEQTDKASDATCLPLISEVVSGQSMWFEEHNHAENIASTAPGTGEVFSGQHISAPLLASGGETFTSEAETSTAMNYTAQTRTVIVKQEPVSPVQETYLGFPTGITHLGADSNVTSVSSDQYCSSVSESLFESSPLANIGVLPRQDYNDKGDEVKNSLALLGAEVVTSLATHTPKSKRKTKTKTKGSSGEKTQKKGAATQLHSLVSMDTPHIPAGDVENANGTYEEKITMVGAPSLLQKEGTGENGFLGQSPVQRTTRARTLAYSGQGTDEEIPLATIALQASTAVDSKENASSPPFAAQDNDNVNLKSVLPSSQDDIDSCLSTAAQGSAGAAVSKVTAASPKKKRRPAKKGWGGHKKSRERSRKKASAPTSSIICFDSPEESKTCARSKLLLKTASVSSVVVGDGEAIQSYSTHTPPKRRKQNVPQTLASKVTKTSQASATLPSVDCVTANLNSFLAKLQKKKENGCKMDYAAGTGTSASDTAGSSGERVVGGVGSDSGKEETIGSTTAKPVHERSFFDCLPQDFLSAWKS